jgi:stage II sporulation protein D (peptidoglycan lytic transglycosylase)
MSRGLILILSIYFIFPPGSRAQVNVRLFSSRTPESAVFSVSSGRYELETYQGIKIGISGDEPVLISRFNGKLAVKTRSEKGVVCDSILLRGMTGKDSFSVRLNGKDHIKQYYSGDLRCFPDLGTILLINRCDIETYIAGVVRAEGGSGKNEEYFKTQAILARTYMYRYFNKHKADRYNLCDDTHCQVFSGLSGDPEINRAVLKTKGLVILSRDSSLIISAFHSNCGGETALPENVWLTGMPYLKRVTDPWCLSSVDSKWEKRVSLREWTVLLKSLGYAGGTVDPSLFTFIQKSRQDYYRAGSFSVPLRVIRAEMNLRSTFFSVSADGDSLILRGKGYGHGVGLCQEGAMSMAGKGFGYRQIIDFYYNGVLVTNIKNAVFLDRDSTAGVP